MRQAIWVAILGGSALFLGLLLTGRVELVTTPSVVTTVPEGAKTDGVPEAAVETEVATLDDGGPTEEERSAATPDTAVDPGAVDRPDRRDNDPVAALPEPGVTVMPGEIAAPVAPADPALASIGPAGSLIPQGGAPSSIGSAGSSGPIEPASVPERADDDPVETLAAPATTSEDALGAPRFDVVRVEDDGHAVIAGRAEPGAEVEVLLDGAPVASATVGRAGTFAAFTELGTSAEPRALQLRVTHPRDDSLGSQDPGAPGSEPGSPEVGPSQPSSADAPAVVIALATTGTDDDALVGDVDRSLAPRVPQADPVHGARLSAPLVLLPTGGGRDAAPVVVSPGPEQVELVQPEKAVAPGVVLDRLTYAEGGTAVLGGRAGAGNTVRAYANARFVDDARVAETGAWSVEIPTETARATELLRFDEITADGEVVSRVETRFSYDAAAGPQEVRDRTIVVVRGDNLWRIAESFYGEGLRYSVIFDANASQIRDPDLIYPDQVFSVPELVPADE